MSILEKLGRDAAFNVMGYIAPTYWRGLALASREFAILVAEYRKQFPPADAGYFNLMVDNIRDMILVNDYPDKLSQFQRFFVTCLINSNEDNPRYIPRPGAQKDLLADRLTVAAVDNYIDAGKSCDCVPVVCHRHSGRKCVFD